MIILGICYENINGRLVRPDWVGIAEPKVRLDSIPDSFWNSLGLVGLGVYPIFGFSVRVMFLWTKSRFCRSRLLLLTLFGTIASFLLVLFIHTLFILLAAIGRDSLVSHRTRSNQGLAWCSLESSIKSSKRDEEE